MPEGWLRWGRGWGWGLEAVERERRLHLRARNSANNLEFPG